MTAVWGPIRCMGCIGSITGLPHTCAGDKIPPESDWWCGCPEAECQRRQAGEWPPGNPWLSPAAQQTARRSR